MTRCIASVAFAAFLLLPPALQAQQSPLDVSACELAQHPKSFDGKTIRVRGTLSVEFEDFTLDHAGCSPAQGIWLAFGGDVPGIVASTVNDNFRTPGVNLQINGVAYQIKKDESFRRMYALIAARNGDKPEYSVTANLTGTFFSGEEGKLANGATNFRGYGHLGCCSLLVITEVSEVESTPPADLDLSGVVLGPNGEPMVGIVVLNDVEGGDPPLRQQYVTNSKGEFGFSDSGQKLRIENPEYRPVALSVEPGGAAVRVRLEEARRSDWNIVYCHDADAAGRIGFSTLFEIPKTMTLSPFDNGGTKSLFVFPRGSEAVLAELVISTPIDSTVDPESIYSRWLKDGNGTVVGIESRGRTNGYYWRRVYFVGHDLVTYSTPSASHRSLLDHIVDSACIPKP